MSVQLNWHFQLPCPQEGEVLLLNAHHGQALETPKPAAEVLGALTAASHQLHNGNATATSHPGQSCQGKLTLRVGWAPLEVPGLLGIISWGRIGFFSGNCSEELVPAPARAAVGGFALPCRQSTAPLLLLVHGGR